MICTNTFARPTEIDLKSQLNLLPAMLAVVPGRHWQAAFADGFTSLS
jgi:hypothetical protein